MIRAGCRFNTQREKRKISNKNYNRWRDNKMSNKDRQEMI